MKRPNNTKTALALAIGVWLSGTTRAAAQSTIMCPQTGPTFRPSPGFCDGIPYAFPPGECNCSPLTFSVHQCQPPGTGGGSVDGLPGCVVGTCSYLGEVECVAAEPQGCAVPGEPAAPRSCEGKPVSLTTGEMFFTHHDATVGALGFSRSFNTARLLTNRYGIFGPGWNSSADKRLRILSAGVIEHRGIDGFATFYQDPNQDGTFEQQRPFGKDTWLVNTGLGYMLVRRAGGQEIFGTTGALISETDAAGVTTTYTRDGAGRLTGMSRDGRSLTLTYVGSQTKPATLQGAATDVLATFSYDASGRLAAVDYPDGDGYRYLYDTTGRILFVDKADGSPSEGHDYDTQGRALTSETADGRDKFTFSYDSATRTTVTDALGKQTIYEYQMVKLVKRITRITGPCDGACGAGAEVQEWTYNPDTGKVTSRRDAAGKLWTYAYDPITLDLIGETDPLSQTSTTSYDAQGRMLTRTGPDGSVTTYVQSDPGPTSIAQKVTASPVTTRTTNIQYFTTSDAKKGKVESITDPRGKTTTMAYDAATGDLLSVTDPLSHSTQFGYDEAPSPPGRGLRTSVTDALGHTTKTVYEGRNRVKKVINHDNTFTEFGYDAAGRRSTVTDPMGRVTRYIYDRYGRLDTVVDPMNQSTRYSYDLMGNLLTLTDAKNQTTTFEYDLHDRVKKTIYPGGAYETFTYDSRGRLATMVDRKNVTTTYAYDDLGRLTGKTFSDGTPAFSYTYDLAGRMLTAANGTDTLTWTYNLAGELLSEQSVKNASTVAYTYDDGGNRLSVSLDGTLFVTYGYDDASRLTTITRGTNVFGFGYDNANRRTSMSYPNGVATAYTYDNLNRLTNLAATHVPTSTPITNFGYQYDAAGNRTQKSTLDYTEDYGYDPLYRLTSTDRTNPGATPPNQWTWNYDAVGNRTSAQKDSEATTSSYNEKNQLTGATGGGKMLWRGTLDEPGIATFSAPTINGQPARMLAGNVFEATLDLPAGANTVTIQAQDGSGNVATKVYSVNVIGVPSSYTYDANGNLTAKTEGADSWTYSWNALNQLTVATKNAAVQATYSYDPLGRRVERIAGTTTTGWTYDGEDITRQNLTVSGVTTATRFVHSSGVDEPTAQENAKTGVVTYLHADALGSIARHTSGSGVATEAIAYDAWGNIQSGAPGPYAFTGREWDANVDLYYYRERYYDQRAGRFLNQDPIRSRGGMNLYAYVQGRPTTLVDPLGLAPVTNNSGKPIPYKPENCTGTPCPIKLCPPGDTCDADGIYPLDCKSNPIKVTDKCHAEVLPDGSLVVTCPFPYNLPQNGPVVGPVLDLARRVYPKTPWPGGPVSPGFMDSNKDWAPPASAPGCQSAKCGTNSGNSGGAE